jgi:hypothetical protein
MNSASNDLSSTTTVGSSTSTIPTTSPTATKLLREGKRSARPNPHIVRLPSETNVSAGCCVDGVAQMIELPVDGSSSERRLKCLWRICRENLINRATGVHESDNPPDSHLQPRDAGLPAHDSGVAGDGWRTWFPDRTEPGLRLAGGVERPVEQPPLNATIDFVVCNIWIIAT